MEDNHDILMNSTPDLMNDAAAAPAEPAAGAVPAAGESQMVSGTGLTGSVDGAAAPQSPVTPGVAPQNAAPQSTAPQNAVPQNAAPQSTASQNAAPQGTASQNAAPQSTAPQMDSTAQSSVKKAPVKEKKKFSLKEWVPGPQVPNQLTIIRICMIPLFVVLILWVPKPLGNILAMITFILASLTDAADGYIARRYNYVTTFGKFMDPLADKLLVCSALICLVDLGRIESWIVIIIIAREFIISGFRLVAADKGVVIAANIWGKLKTIAQMIMVILMVGNFGGFLGVVAVFLKWIALALTLISLATYMLQNRHVLEDNV